MGLEKTKIKEFTDLKVWQVGHELAITIYFITKKFPKEEMYLLVSQMRRCAISITSNIAEGFGRKSYKEKVQFYYLAQGSLTELKNQILLAKEVGYLTTEDFSKLLELANETHKILQGLIKSSKARI